MLESDAKQFAAAMQPMSVPPLSRRKAGKSRPAGIRGPRDADHCQAGTRRCHWFEVAVPPPAICRRTARELGDAQA